MTEKGRDYGALNAQIIGLEERRKEAQRDGDNQRVNALSCQLYRTREARAVVGEQRIVNLVQAVLANIQD